MKESSLLPLLKKKKGFFLSILDLTQNEASLSSDELTKVLRQKKTLLSCIEKVDQQIKKFRDSFSVALPQEIQEELAEIRSVILRKKNRTGNLCQKSAPVILAFPIASF